MPRNELDFHPLPKPSLITPTRTCVDDSARHPQPNEFQIPHSYHSNSIQDNPLRLFFGLKHNREGKAPGHHPQAKQPVHSHVPDTRRTTPFLPGTVMQEWNNHAHGSTATVSASGSPTRSDIKSMSVDEGSLDSILFRKRSSKMSVDHSPLTGICRKASSRMSVDPSSPNVYHSTQGRASSPMSVDVPSFRRCRGSSDRMLFDEIHKHYPTQNLSHQAYIHLIHNLTAFPTVSPTKMCHRSASAYGSQEHTPASGAPLPTSFPMTVSQPKSSQSHDGCPARAKEILALTPSDSSRSPSSYQQRSQDKENHEIILLKTTVRSPPNTSQPPPSLIPSAPAHPPGQTDSIPASLSETVSQRNGIPAPRQWHKLPSTERKVLDQFSPSRSCVRTRESSSTDEVSHKRQCVRQNSQPVALLSIDPRSAGGPPLHSSQSLSPIDEVWLPPMEQQLDMARQSQLKARFKKFKAVIGRAVSEIKQAMVPYNKDRRKRKATRMSSDSDPFAGVPDYLRSAERFDPVQDTDAPQSHKRTSFDIQNDVDNLAKTWTNLALCDSPTALQGNDRDVHSEVSHLLLSRPRINEPPRIPTDYCPLVDVQETMTKSSYTRELLPIAHRQKTVDAWKVKGEAAS